MNKLVPTAACIAITLIACREPLYIGDEEAASPQPTASPLQRSIAFSQTQPIFLRPAEADAVPDGITDLKASSCGACHTEIYEEWRISTHARAWADDPQFQAELHKPRANGSDVTWMCRNCHTPLRSQQPELVVGLQNEALDRPIYETNPHFDAELQQDAITCASCHVRDGVVLGPFGDSAAPHPVKKSDQLLSNEVCTDCHQAKAWFEELALACVFNTGTEFEDGPYAKEGFTCQQCHMPKVQRPLVVGGQARATRRHWFGGSLIPKQERFKDELSEIRKHYPDGLTTDWIDPPKIVLAGSAIKLKYYVYNKNAGHRLPTGDPERFLLVTARVKDANGATLAEYSERIGAVWEWSPQPRQISDNRLAPRERRTHALELSVPNSGPLTLELEASKWRISEANLDYHQLRGKLVPGRVFHSASRTLDVR
jgi:hypothetical protein